jgi:uncharacterized coiled-coil protein SlyX
MQKHLPALMIATLAVTLIVAVVSMYVALRQRDLAERLARLEQRVADDHRSRIESITGMVPEALVEKMKSGVEAVEKKMTEDQTQKDLTPDKKE